MLGASDVSVRVGGEGHEPQRWELGAGQGRGYRWKVGCGRDGMGWDSTSELRSLIFWLNWLFLIWWLLVVLVLVLGVV